MTIKLKPCKFCHNEATIIKYSIIGTSANLYIVRCKNPKCSNSEPTSQCYLAEEAAAEAWNKENDKNHDRA